MTLRSRLFSAYPFVHAVLVMGCVCWFISALGSRQWTESLLALVGVIFALYVLPVATYRIHNAFCPLKEGGSSLQGRLYSPWWGGHQIQGLFIAFPWIESVLHLIPGLFSLWLRAWGSRVGKGVYWTPRVEIVDRGLLEIGDFAVFGHCCGLSAHVVTVRKGQIRLYVRRIQVGEGALIGSEARLGPGTKVGAGVELAHGTKATLNTEFPSK